MTTIASILYNIIQRINQERIEWSPKTQAIRNAHSIVINALKREGLPLAAIQGPPGTGKTELARGALYNLLDYVLNEKDLKFIYIAPTNELVTQAFIRISELLIPLLYENGIKINEIVRMFRIYGSRIPRPYYGVDRKKLPDTISAKDLEKIVGGHIDDNVKFILTTEYQRVTGGALSEKYRYLTFIDEASRSPFYLPFTPTVDAMYRLINQLQRRSHVIESLSIVGDPEQAIAIGDEYKGYGKDYLALPRMVNILEEIGGLSNFTMLNETIRIPDPLHKPISVGFYNEQLKAIDTVKQRFKSHYGISFDRNKCIRVLGHYCSDVCDCLEEALTTDRALIIANTNSKLWGESYETYKDEGDTYEPARIRLAVYFAAGVLSSVSANRSLDVVVTAPYVQLVDSAEFQYKQLFHNLQSPRFITVQSMLGSEADVIIAMLGKEFIGSPDYPTMYYSEPEVLNVQLSRARLFMVVIGDVYRLRSHAAKKSQEYGLKQSWRYKSFLAPNTKKIWTTAKEMLEEMAHVESRSSKANGDEAIYCPFLSNY